MQIIDEIADYHIASIEFVPAKHSVSITFLLQSKNIRKILILIGVEEFSGDGIRVQNVADLLRIYRGQDADSVELARLVEIAFCGHFSPETKTSALENHLKSLIQRVESCELCVVVLESAFGAQFVCLAKSFELSVN